MRRLLQGGAAVLLTAFVGGACQSPAHPERTHQIPALLPSARPPTTVTLTPERVNQAAKLWIAKCARCHPLYDPSFYNDVDWHYWMTKMTRRAHLKPDQELLLSLYLDAFRPQ